MEMMKIKKQAKRILPVFLGALGGYAYYYYIGCTSGACPISSNPYVSTLYGSVMGALFIPRGTKRETTKEAER